MDSRSVGSAGSSALTLALPVASASAPATGPGVAPAAAPPMATQASAVPTLKQVQAAIAKTQAALQPVASNLEFSIDQNSGKTIVRVVDAQTGEIIRQIPSEEMLAIARSIDKMLSLMMPSKA